MAADAEVDHEAFEMDSMPSANELTLMDEGEDEAEEEEEDESEVESEDAEEEVSEDAADAALDAADASEEEEVEEAESAEDSESSAEDEAEADAEAEDEVDEAGQARMMQVLEKLATGARDDDSVADLLALIDSLIADVKESIAGAKKRKVAVVTHAPTLCFAFVVIGLVADVLWLCGGRSTVGQVHCSDEEPAAAR